MKLGAQVYLLVMLPLVAAPNNTTGSGNTPPSVADGISGVYNALDVRKIFERPWRGVSVQDAGRLTKSGKIHTKQTMKLSIDSNDIITGQSITTWRLDGKSYTREVSIKGRYYPAEQRIFISDHLEQRGDKLPYGLYWCNTQGYLKIFRHMGKSGGHVLRGIMKGNTSGCESSSELALFDN